MRALLWKDYRQNRRILVAVGIFLLTPYVMVLVFGLVELSRGTTQTGWANLVAGASCWSLGMSVVASAFIAGNAIAGERVDRSAEFAAYLPIPRTLDIASKAILAVGTMLVIWLVNILAGLSAGIALYMSFMEPRALGVMATVAVMVFGVSWLSSTLLRSSAIAAVCGLAAPLLVLFALTLVNGLRGLENNDGTFELWYFPLSFVLGIGCFVAGTLRYVRRKEP